MNGLMMDVPLSTSGIVRRARQLHPGKPIVSRRADRTIHRTTYGECVDRAVKLAAALRRLGVRRGDRVATLAWNHWRHLEIYYAVPSSGAVLHTLNLRLHPDDIAYIANHAEDKVILVDKVLWPLWEKVAPQVRIRHTIVMADDGEVPSGTLDYEALIAAESAGGEFADVPERRAAAMCYTSGTTGKPKGVVYSHRSLMLHAIGLALTDAFRLAERDTVLPVVPMFHVNAWGLPFVCGMLGCGQVHPGPHLDPTSLLELLAAERVTLTAGVPTVWLGILQKLDSAPAAFDLSALHSMVVGGAAAPEGMMRGFKERHGLTVIHAWGMTETSPLGTISRLTSHIEQLDDATQWAYRAKQGRPSPLVEIRARGEKGLIPWDGTAMGELEVRGPWIAGAYYHADDGREAFTEDGWFRTGDVVSIDIHGYVTIQDRAKDLVKSGGEWISSVALEGALMGHPAVAEAAVIAVPHEKWDERPLAAVVLKEGATADPAELRFYLMDKFSKWWIPDEVVIVSAIPKSSAGKFLKSALREQFRDRYGQANPSLRGLSRSS
ncbi:MAG: Long-chain-fatty-acid--CoA ligase [Gemmatimonadaceae bacterium]|nr:Long-chain-fatty-acid--CoA ligase [Gemmatimonadaceae bacterium]